MARRGYARFAAYPGATIAGVFTNSVFGFLRAFVLLAVFQGRGDIGGYSVGSTITYVWLTQGMIATVSIWGWRELALRIRSGDIATDLVRPVHPLRAGLAFDLGRAVYHGIFRGIPPLVVGALAFDLTFPTNPLIWAAFLLSLTLAVIVSFAFRFLYNLTAFWTNDDRGVSVLAYIVASLFSGFLIPLAFFPPWLAAVARATPFPAMMQMPIDIFVGAVDGSEVLTTLVVQLAWAAALLVAARYLFDLGARRLVVQGG